MNCQNHPLAPAAGACAGCAESFCANCLVPIGGVTYCAACKTMALPAGGGAVAVAIVRESDKAKEALRLGLISLFCFGFILGPMAIAAGLKAKSEIAADPTIGGQGKATAGIVIGSISLLMNLFAIFSKLGNL